jgi:hypothetical protein
MPSPDWEQAPPSHASTMEGAGCDYSDTADVRDGSKVPKTPWAAANRGTEKEKAPVERPFSRLQMNSTFRENNR